LGCLFFGVIYAHTIVKDLEGSGGKLIKKTFNWIKPCKLSEYLVSRLGFEPNTSRIRV
jgi:hypothetical protein